MILRLLRILRVTKPPQRLGARVVHPGVFAAKMAAAFKEDK